MKDDVGDKYRKRPSTFLFPRPRIYLSSRSVAATNAYPPVTTAYAGASIFFRIDAIEDVQIWINIFYPGDPGYVMSSRSVAAAKRVRIENAHPGASKDFSINPIQDKRMKFMSLFLLKRPKLYHRVRRPIKFSFGVKLIQFKTRE